MFFKIDGKESYVKKDLKKRERISIFFISYYFDSFYIFTFNGNSSRHLCLPPLSLAS